VLEFVREYAGFLSLTATLLFASFLIRVAFLWIARPVWIDFFARPGLSLILKSALYFLIAVTVVDFRFSRIGIEAASLWILFQGTELKEHLSWRTTSSYSLSDRKTQKIFNRMLYYLPCSIFAALCLRLFLNSNSFADEFYELIRKNILIEGLSAVIGFAVLFYFFCFTYKYRGMISHLFVHAGGWIKFKK